MNKIPKIEIPFEELKYWVLESIKQLEGSFEFKSLCNSIGAKAVTNGIVKNPHPEGFQTIYYPLQQDDENRVREILWDLIIQRVLTIGDFHNDSWPWLSLTEYGKQAIASDQPIPNDSTGYFNRIKKQIPQLDSIIETYLDESIRTYNINQLLSSTITLGCASERSVIILIETYKETFIDSSKKIAFAKKVDDKFIKNQFDEFDKSIRLILSKLPYELREKYVNTLHGVFQMIRYNRNNAGHPTGKKVDKDTLLSSLQIFIIYCKYIYDLKNYFELNKHD